MLYVSAAEGYRSGGFNGRPANTAEISSYDPETLISYEAGFKSQLWSDRIRLNGSVFYTDYKDIQVSLATSTPTGPAIIAQNAARAKTKGAELELAVKPTPALQLGAAVGFLHAKYTEVDPRASYKVGDQLLSSPKWTANAGGEYQVHIGERNRLSGRVDYLYKSAFYFFTTGSATDQQKAYDVVNVRLRFGPDDERWEVSAYGLNVFGTEYSLFRQDALASYGQASEWPAPPAEWGVGVRFKF
jgi:iron complex outermembrane receptor protein